jgi:hypothetical protein
MTLVVVSLLFSILVAVWIVATLWMLVHVGADLWKTILQLEEMRPVREKISRTEGWRGKAGVISRFFLLGKIPERPPSS